MTSRLIPRLLLCHLIMMTTAAFSQEKTLEKTVEKEIKIASTPLKMADLLPEGGIDNFKYDFYLVSRNGNGPDATWGNGYMRYTAKKSNGQLVISFVNGQTGGAEIVFTTRLTYNTTGEFVSYQNIVSGLKLAFGLDLINDSYGEPYLGELYVKRKQITRQAFGPKKGEVDRQVFTNKLSLPEKSGALSNVLEPVILAYHARQGDLRYNYAQKNHDSDDGPSQHNLEVQGSEKVMFDGKEHTVRVLLITSKYNGEEYKARLSVFENGEFYSFIPENGAYTKNSCTINIPFQRVTPSEFEKILNIKLDENGDPPLSWENQKAF